MNLFLIDAIRILSGDSVGIDDVSLFVIVLGFFALITVIVLLASSDLRVR